MLKHKKHLPIKLPKFYRAIVTSWHACGGGRKAPQNAAYIKEIIWGNKHIQTKGKTIYFKHWKDGKITFIVDLIDKDGNFLKGEDIIAKLKNTSNWISEYHFLLKSIPNTWKEKLKAGDTNIKVKKEFKPFLESTQKTNFDLPCKAKGYYELFVNKIKKRTYLENIGIIYSPTNQKGQKSI